MFVLISSRFETNSSENHKIISNALFICVQHCILYTIVSLYVVHSGVGSDTIFCGQNCIWKVLFLLILPMYMYIVSLLGDIVYY